MSIRTAMLLLFVGSLNVVVVYDTDLIDGECEDDERSSKQIHAQTHR